MDIVPHCIRGYTLLNSLFIRIAHIAMCIIHSRHYWVAQVITKMKISIHSILGPIHLEHGMPLMVSKTVGVCC